jgi:hypothetical protein
LGDPCDDELSSANNPRPEVHRDQANQWTEHCESNSDARNYRSGKLRIGRARNARQTQLPPPGIELRRCSQLSLQILDSASIPGAAIRLAAAPVNGLSAANLKEPFPVCVASWVCFHAILLKHSKIDISQNVNFLSECLERGTRETIPRRGKFFPYLATIFRPSGSDSTSCDHGLPFITIQWPLSSGDTDFRGYGHAKRASALAAAAINSVASIALVFIK